MSASGATGACGGSPSATSRGAALTHGFGEQGVGEPLAPVGPGRDELGDDAVSIGDEHRLASSREADVLAQPVLQGLQADRTFAR
jgi:hypothetical protein